MGTCVDKYNESVPGVFVGFDFGPDNPQEMDTVKLMQYNGPSAGYNTKYVYVEHSNDFVNWQAWGKPGTPKELPTAISRTDRSYLTLEPPQ